MQTHKHSHLFTIHISTSTWAGKSQAPRMANYRQTLFIHYVSRAVFGLVKKKKKKKRRSPFTKAKTRY